MRKAKTIKNLVARELYFEYLPMLEKVNYAEIDLPTHEEYSNAIFLDASNRGKANGIKYSMERNKLEEKRTNFEKAYNLPFDFPTTQIFGGVTDYEGAFMNLVKYSEKVGENTERRYAEKCEKSKKCKVLGFTDAERIAVGKIKAIVNTDLGQFKMTVIDADGEHNVYHTRVLFHKI